MRRTVKAYTGSNDARVTKVRAAALGTRGCSDKSATSGQHNISSFRVASWNVDSMTGRAGELVKAFGRRKLDIVCVQETRWKGAGTRIFGEQGGHYKFFWQGGTDGTAGVGIFVAEKWIECVVEVSRISERIMMIKFVLGNMVVNVLSLYSPQVGRSEEEKDVFWDKVFQLVNNIPQNDVVIVAGDLNGHVGKTSSGYEGVHGGFGYGDRNVEGVRILEFGDAMNLVICNTMFTKDDMKLVTYESGSVKSVVDYVLVRKKDRRLVRNAKIIAGEECVYKHKLLVIDFSMQGGLRKNKRTYIPRLRTWKLADGACKEEFAK